MPKQCPKSRLLVRYFWYSINKGMSNEIANTRKLKPATILGRVDASSFNADTNEVNVVFATESLVAETMGEGSTTERFYEQLDVTTKAADLQRFNNGAAVLDNHKVDSITNQLGKVIRAWVNDANKEAWATLKLSTAPGWADVVHDIKDGTIGNISFTFRRKRMVDTGIEKDGLRVLKTIEWEGLEISFVTIPADFKAGVRSETNTENEVIIITNKNTNTMTEQEKQQRIEGIKEACRKLKLDDAFTNTLVANEAITLDAARALAIEEATKPPVAEPVKPVNVDELKGKEKQRFLDITAVCRKLKLDQVEAEKGVFFVDQLIGKDITVDQARALAIDKAAEIQAVEMSGLDGHGGTHVKPNAEREAKRAQAKEHAIMQRAGIVLLADDGKVVKLEPDVYRGMTLKEIAFEGLVERGLNPRTMKQEEVAQWVLNKEFIMRSAGGMTTSDFPSITENVLNKFGLQRYNLADRTFDPLIKKRSVRDFKQISNVRLNDVVINKKSKISEGGEYTMIAMTDGNEKYAINKYGKKAVLSWESLINDDLSMFNDVVATVMDGFAQFQGDLFYELLTSNTAIDTKANVMADGKTIFHADHANLATGSAIGIESLNAARVLLLNQKAPNGSLLNLMAKYLVVGPNNIQTAEQFTSVNYTPNEAGKINKYGATLTPIVDARITDNRWFLVAEPSRIPTIEVAHLDGQEMYTESRYSFDVDGMEIKFRMTHGIKAIDYRGFVKNPGA